jgi:uncharacterized membrane protein
MEIDLPSVLGLVFRWLHILAAITAVGGTIFARFVVFPSLEPLQAEQRRTLHAVMRGRWAKIVAASIGFLILSGLYNFMITITQFRVPPWYQLVFGIKFMVAMAIFSIASLLVGRTSAAEAFRKNAKTWLNVNIALAVLVVCLSGVLRTAVKIPKNLPGQVPQPVPAETQSEKPFAETEQVN